MANILDKYGIKEVADVTFYSLADDGTPAFPVLYLDTLKVSTIEQTAELAEAKGGKGNVSLVAWDYGKEINVTLEDALFSAKSMAIMFGNGSVDPTTRNMQYTIEWTCTTTGVTDTTYYVNVHDQKYALTGVSFYNINTKVGPGNTTDSGRVEPTAVVADTKYFVTGTIPATNPGTIVISAESFPGTYYITGDTYARSAESGQDEFFQFIIHKAKVTAENTITLEAEGDPSVFNLNLRVLRPANKETPMMELVKYDLTPNS